MKRVVFTGAWKELIRLGYRANCPDIDYFRSYTKAATKGILRVAKTRDVVLNTYSEELTAKIYNYLVDNGFQANEEPCCLVLEKKTENIVPFDFQKHNPIGVYGYDCSNAELDEVFNAYDFYHLSGSLVQFLKELYDSKLVELKEIQQSKKKSKLKAV